MQNIHATYWEGSEINCEGPLRPPHGPRTQFYSGIWIVRTQCDVDKKSIEQP